ncbi:MAG: TetR family transcriptional regulator [Methylobacteriaceae bacterium]|nr:TetR family transcriptional regulator [Methylobacteriaceae bacterium]
MGNTEVNTRLQNDASRPARDAAATRRKLVAAGVQLFSAQAYEQVGVRAIADLAGVNQALLNRYFGGKAGLFAAVVRELFDEPNWFGTDRAGFGERLTAVLFEKVRDERADPLGLIIRSSAHREAAATVRDAVDDAVVEPLAAWLDRDDARTAAGTIAAVLTGVSVLRSLLASRSMTGEAEAAQRAAIAKLLQAIVDGST